MARVSYEPSVLNAIIQSAIAVREAGKPWKDAFAAAKKAGFKGAESTLQKIVRAEMLGGKPNHATDQHDGFKNSKNAPESIVSGMNAFQKTPVESASPSKPTVDVPPVTTTRSPETLESIQNRLPVLREGTRYPRPISLFDGAFQASREGEIVAWSQILEKNEALRVTNSNGHYPRGADVLVDSILNPLGSFLTVIHVDGANTESGSYAVGTRIPVQRRADGTAFVAIRDIRPSVSMLLSNALDAVACSLETEAVPIG